MMKTTNFNKRLIAAAVSSICAVSAISSNAIAKNSDANVDGFTQATLQQQEGVRYIVKFKSQSESAMRKAADDAGITIAEARKAANTRTLNRHGAKMKLNLSSVNAAAVILNKVQVSALSKDADVEYIEVDPKRYLIDSVITSDNVSPQAESTPYGIGLVQADQVSDANTGNMGICITDTGYEGNHEDLVPYTDARITGNDNDGLGNDTGNWWEPGHAHGTHVAGTIAAIGNNGTGVTSVNPNALLKIHNVKIFNNSGSWAYGSDLVRTVEQCQAAGSNIISMSIGGSGSSQTEENAFINAANAGMLHIAAAGNDGNSSLSYPASYDSVMSVGALNSSKQIASFSQYNSQVEIAAPGVSVTSTVLNNGYATWDGTSMATPHVSAVAALVWSHYQHCSAAQIRQALGATAEDLGAGGRDNYYGYGLVQAKAMYDALAVSCDVEYPTPPPPPEPGVLENGVSHDNLSGASGEETFWTMDVPSGATDISITMSGGSGDADLYTKFGSAPTTSDYDCRPYASGNNETCTGSQDNGTYHVMIRGYSAYSGVSLVGSFNDDGGTTPPPGDYDLTASGYKVKGRHHADLSWTGNSGSVDIYRDGSVIASGVGGSSYTDAIGNKGGGSYVYQVCDAGTSTCSDSETISF